MHHSDASATSQRTTPWVLGASLLATLGLVTLSPACSSGPECVESFRELGTAEDVCLRAQTSSTATTAIGQTDVCYDKPQICPSLQPIGFCSRLVDSPDPASFNLLLQNFGQTPLTITGVRVRGDDRCAFTAPLLSPGLGEPIPPNDGMIFRFKYDPKEVGEDHILLEFESDAENFPVLTVAVCGQGIMSNDPDDFVCIDCQDRSDADYTTCWEDET